MKSNLSIPSFLDYIFDVISTVTAKANNISIFSIVIFYVFYSGVFYVLFSHLFWRNFWEA